MTYPIILASGSAIRRQILDGAGLDYNVIVKPVDEAAIKASMLAEGAKPRDIADALAEAKSVRVSRQTPGLVIGADQIMEMDGDIGEGILSSVGAYKFEGRGSQLFSHVEGDFFSILGLSLLPVLDYLRTRGALIS